MAALNLTHLNNGAHFQFIKNILTDAEKDTAVVRDAETQVTALRTAFDAENEALVLSRKNALSDDITAADNERDELFLGFKKAVKAYLSFPMEDYVKAAKTLQQHLIDYNSLTATEQMDQETALMTNFISDIETKYTAEIETLNLGTFVEKMKAANEKVEEYRVLRKKSKMTQTIGALRKARLATDEAYKKLIEMVKALALVKGSNDYAAFLQYVETEIVSFKRDSLGEKASAETGSTGTTTTDTSTSGGTTTGGTTDTSTGGGDTVQGE